MSDKSKSNGMVVGIEPSDYKVTDNRLMKPVFWRAYDNDVLTGSMLFQGLDTVRIPKRGSMSYFSPNSIATLLSTNSRSLRAAREIFEKNFLDNSVPINFDEVKGDRRRHIEDLSSVVCDYLELIQSSVVFGYTAIETFANLSIPSDYTYKCEGRKPGIEETYNKDAIERWVSLDEKLRVVLRDVYTTPKVQDKKWWSDFKELEDIRHNIIHQKSISSTEFYKKYFKEKIFNVCESPTKVTSFFYETLLEQEKTHPIWPWLDGRSNNFPTRNDFNSAGFEKIGNIYEGIQKQPQSNTRKPRKKGRRMRRP